MEVVDAVGNRLALLGDEEVVYPNPFGCALWPPFAAGVLEVSDQLLLLRVHRDRRLSTLLEATNLVEDVVELRVAIRVLGPFAGLAVGLQTVAARLQKLGDQGVAHPVPLGPQLLRQATHALRRPTQRRVGIARCRRLHERVQVRTQRHVLLGRSLAPSSRPARSFRTRRCVRLELPDAAFDCRPCQSRRFLHPLDTATPQRARLRRRPQPFRSFREHQRQGCVLCPQGLRVHCGEPRLSWSLLELPETGGAGVVVAVGS
jgi:hypothetical protein